MNYGLRLSIFALICAGCVGIVMFFVKGQGASYNAPQAVHISVSHPDEDKPNGSIAELYWATLPDAQSTNLSFVWDRPMGMKNVSGDDLAGSHLEDIIELVTFTNLGEHAKDNLDERFKAMDIGYGAYTGPFKYNLSIRGNRLKLNEIADTLTPLFNLPKLDIKHGTKHLARGQRSLRGQIRSLKNGKNVDPNLYIGPALFALHPQRHQIQKHDKSVYYHRDKQQVAADVDAAYQQTIRANAPIIFGAGPQSADEIQNFVRRSLGPAARKPVDLQPIETTVSLAPKIVIFPDSQLQATRFWAFGQAPAFQASDDVGEMLSSRLFTGDLTTPLMRTLRGQLRASYALQLNYYDYGKGVQVYELEGDLDTRQVPEAISAFRDVYAKYRAIGPHTQGTSLPNRDVFEEAKKNLYLEHQNYLVYPDQVETELTEVYRFGLDPQHALTLARRINSASLHGHLDFLQSYLRPVDELLLVLGTSDANKLKNTLIRRGVAKAEDICAVNHPDEVIPCLNGETE